MSEGNTPKPETQRRNPGAVSDGPPPSTLSIEDYLREIVRSEAKATRAPGSRVEWKVVATFAAAVIGTLATTLNHCATERHDERQHQAELVRLVTTTENPMARERLFGFLATYFADAGETKLAAWAKQRNASVAENRRRGAVVANFCVLFDEWEQRSAEERASLSSLLVTASDRALAWMSEDDRAQVSIGARGKFLCRTSERPKGYAALDRVPWSLAYVDHLPIIPPVLLPSAKSFDPETRDARDEREPDEAAPAEGPQAPQPPEPSPSVAPQ